MNNFIDNKYYRWYRGIVVKAQGRVLEEGTYIEKHHILPKCMGGVNTPENLVRLTAREHYICHLILTKCTKGADKDKMIHAIWIMSCKYPNCVHKTKISGHTYEYLRKKASILISMVNKGNLHNLGKKRTIESRMRMRISQLGKKQSIDTIQKRVQKNRGKKRTVEQRKHIGNKKGFRHTVESINANREAHLKYVYSIEDIDGTIIKISNLKQFSKNNNIDDSFLSESLLTGKFCKNKYRVIKKENLHDN
jgi:hypothetical protein